MRFRWCGDADCPDWVLAEMATLSRLSSVKLKLLATLVAQALTEPPFNMEKAEKLFTDSKLESGCDEFRGCVSCVAWIMRSATRAGCDTAALGGELQQLGLPREHAHALQRVYMNHVAALRAHLYQQSLRVNPLCKTTFQSLPATDLVELELATGREEDIEKRRVLVPRALLDTVLQDLRTALTTMEELCASDHAL